MSKFISDILGAKEPDFSQFILEWEHLAGRPGVDIRLSSEIQARQRQTLKDLGLDSVDTTSQEIYHTLRRRALRDADTLNNFLSIGENDKPNLMIAKVLKFILPLISGRQLWVIKPSVTRRILKEHPPSKLMKAIGARSIDSILKRENPNLLLALAMVLDVGYKAKIIKCHKKLTPRDFDLRKIDIIPLKQDKIAKLKSQGYKIDDLILPVYETGSIVVVVPSQRRSGDSLLFLALLLETARNALMYSAYFRVASMRPTFGRLIGQVIERGIADGSKETVTVGWPVLHNLIENDPKLFPASLQPHVQPDDFMLPNIALLANRLPELKFWEDKIYVLRSDNKKRLSYNLLDVLINDLNSLDYVDSIDWYGKSRLQDALFSRYLAHRPLRQKTIKLD